jgi:hypothetical protein
MSPSPDDEVPGWAGVLYARVSVSPFDASGEIVAVEPDGPFDPVDDAGLELPVLDEAGCVVAAMTPVSANSDATVTPPAILRARCAGWGRWCGRGGGSHEPSVETTSDTPADERVPSTLTTQSACRP